jgi:hypothetical protein
VTKKVRGENGDKKKLLMENIEITLSGQGRQLSVGAHPVFNKKLDLWDWKAKKYDPVDLEVDFIIEIPDNILNYGVSTGVGNIKINNIRGTFDVETGVGDAELKQIVLERKSTIKTGTGNIVLNLSSMVGAGELYIETGVGDVDIQIPADENYDVDIESSSEAPKQKVISSGKASIKVKAGVGNVNVEKIESNAKK